MIVKKYGSKYEIVDSGLLYSVDKNDSVKLELIFDDEFTFSIELAFEHIDNHKQGLKVSVNNDNKLIKFTCTNFENSFGTGTSKPIEVATYNDKKIYLYFYVYMLGVDSGRKIDYCLFQGSGEE